MALIIHKIPPRHHKKRVLSREVICRAGMYYPAGSEPESLYDPLFLLIVPDSTGG
jgi:hypothetical protein